MPDKYFCDTCGGILVLNTTGTKHVCTLCDTEYEVNFGDSVEQTENTTQGTVTADNTSKISLTKSADTDDTIVTDSSISYDTSIMLPLHKCTCTLCSTEFYAKDIPQNAVCPYCDTPLTCSSSTSMVSNLAYVLPFSVDEKHALSALSAHCLREDGADAKFVNKLSHIKLVRTYKSCWLASADVDFDLQFTGIRGTDIGIEYYNCHRSGVFHMKNCICDTSTRKDELSLSVQSIKSDEIQAISTSDTLPDLIEYDRDILYTQSYLDNIISDTLLTTLEEAITGYDDSSLVSKKDTITNLQRVNVLVPVWHARIEYNGKPYKFIIDGRTGTCKGKPALSLGSKISQFIKDKPFLQILIIGVILALLVWSDNLGK